LKIKFGSVKRKCTFALPNRGSAERLGTDGSSLKEWNSSIEVMKVALFLNIAGKVYKRRIL
jgi:hypothetical protein